MKIFFSTSGAAVSKLIRWTFKEDVSHCGILFDSKLLFHSSLFGVDLQGIYAFEKKSRIIYSIDIPMSLQAEEAIYQGLLQHYEGKSYDYRAFAYFAWRGFLYRFLGIDFPSRNAWQRPDDFLCDGFVAILKDCPECPGWLRKAISDLGDVEMKSPGALHRAILEAVPKGSVQTP
jgi:hypothetical protein